MDDAKKSHRALKKSGTVSFVDRSSRSSFLPDITEEDELHDD